MHLQQQRIRSPDAFRLTDVNTVKHDSKHQRPSFPFIHITSEQPIHIVGIRTDKQSDLIRGQTIMLLWGTLGARSDRCGGGFVILHIRGVFSRVC